MSQRLPASQRILNLGVSLNYVSGWIIGPFHQTVKIWSSHLDIQPGVYQIFVKVRIIGYNPRDFRINQTTQDWRSTACKQSRAWDRELKAAAPKV